MNQVIDTDRRRHRRRRWLIAVLAVILGMNACWALFWLGCYVARAPVREFRSLVRVGMTRDEVRAAAGKPDHVAQPGVSLDKLDGVAWYPKQDFTIRRPAYVYYGGPLRMYRFCVLFDQEGRVERVFVQKT